MTALQRRNATLLVVAVVTIAAMALVNRLANSSAQIADSSASTTSRTKPSGANPAQNPPGGGAETQALITEATVGDIARAKFRATFGYRVNTYVATHPDEVNQVIGIAESWARTGEDNSVQIVCLDIPPAMRKDPSTANVPLGLAINGKRVKGLEGTINSANAEVVKLRSALYGITRPVQYAEQKQELKLLAEHQLPAAPPQSGPGQ